MVKVHGYDNPTNSCPACKAAPNLPTGCCDNFANLDTCETEEKCDNAFFYCLKPFNSSVDLDSTHTSRCGFHTGDGRISSLNTDGAPIDFSRRTVLGIPNPFPLTGITPKWTVTYIHQYMHNKGCMLDAIANSQRTTLVQCQ